MNKTCARCAESKPQTAFHSRGRGKRESICGVCRSEVRQINGRWKRQETPEQRRARRLWESYKITVEQYTAMLNSQDGGCAICQKHPDSDEPLRVDHCHTTGVVRALLCNLCNLQIGVYEQTRQAALTYLAMYGNGNPLLKP